MSIESLKSNTHKEMSTYNICHFGSRLLHSGRCFIHSIHLPVNFTIRYKGLRERGGQSKEREIESIVIERQEQYRSRKDEFGNGRKTDRDKRENSGRKNKQ